MHHTAGVFASVILHFGAWSFTIYLRRLHIDLHEDQSLYQLNQSYCFSYGTFCYIESTHAQQHLFCYPAVLSSLMHHTTGIFANFILHLGAWSLTIYLRRLHIDLHEDQPLHQLNQSYYSSYGTFCCIKSAHTQQHLFCYPSSTIRFNNMIITYGFINTIMIMQPIL